MGPRRSRAWTATADCSRCPTGSRATGVKRPVRRFLITAVLPMVFTLLPVLVGAAVVVALPAEALHDYLRRIRTSTIDWLILGLGA